MFLSVFVLVFICTMLISNISSQAKGFLIPLKTDCNQQKLNWVVRLVHYSVSKAHKDYCQFSCWPAEEKKKRNLWRFYISSRVHGSTSEQVYLSRCSFKPRWCFCCLFNYAECSCVIIITKCVGLCKRQKACFQSTCLFCSYRAQVSSRQLDANR